jgi:hypothetical protein
MKLNRRQFFGSTIGAALALVFPWKKARPVEWCMNTTVTGIDGSAMREHLRDRYGVFLRHAHPSQAPAKCIMIGSEAFKAVKADIAQNERFGSVPPPDWAHALAFKGTWLVADSCLSGMDFGIIPRDSDFAIKRATGQ